MAELFIELFSEEIPAKLQIDARNKIKQMLDEKLKKKEINFKTSHSFSTPKRLALIITGIPRKIEQKGKVFSKRIDLMGGCPCLSVCTGMKEWRSEAQLLAPDRWGWWDGLERFALSAAKCPEHHKGTQQKP